MYHVVFLETERQGDFNIDLQSTADTHVYTTQPFLLGIRQSINQPYNFDQKVNITKGSFKGYMHLQVTFDTPKLYTFPVFTQDGYETQMYSKFDIQLVTPYEGELGDPIEVKFPRAFCLGHRGNGMNKYTKELLENTLPAFTKGVESGSDFVEFDVQFTKDRIPVIFHDFTLKTNHTYKNAEYVRTEGDCTEYAIQQLTLEQFKKAGLRTEYQTPFNSLHDMLMVLPENVSFDMEIKSIFEEPHLIGEVPYPDRNELIDAVLEELEAFGGDRQIFFSSFDPMVIMMLQLKQQRYPMLQLNCKEDFETEKTAMSRLLSLISAYRCMNIKGFVLDSDLILGNKELIQNMQKDYLICSYGKYNTTENTVLEQLELGIRGICTDNIPHVSKVVHSFH